MMSALFAQSFELMSRQIKAGPQAFPTSCAALNNGLPADWHFAELPYRTTAHRVYGS